MSRAGLWEALETDWVVLDCELLPWSAKAMELIRRQYAAVGAAGGAALSASVGVLAAAGARGLDVDALLDRTRDRRRAWSAYTAAYGRYIWPVNGLEDLRLAPFHVLAAESGAFASRDHAWHLGHCDALVEADPDWIRRTERRVVEVTDPSSEAEATEWWEAMTASGGEGMVVKPMTFTARGRRGQVQPGVKVRGREYLRIIYGPEYDAPDQIDRLRSRGLGRKRSLAVARVRARCRGSGAVRAPRAAVPRARVRLRRPGAGVRAGRPALVNEADVARLGHPRARVRAGAPAA